MAWWGLSAELQLGWLWTDETSCVRNVFEGLCAQAPTSYNIVLSCRPPACGPLDPREEPTGVQEGGAGGGGGGLRDQQAWQPPLPPRSCYLLPSSSTRGVTPNPFLSLASYCTVEAGSEGPPWGWHRIIAIPSLDPGIPADRLPLSLHSTNIGPSISQLFFGFICTLSPHQEISLWCRRRFFALLCFAQMPRNPYILRQCWLWCSLKQSKHLKSHSGPHVSNVFADRSFRAPCQ